MANCVKCRVSLNLQLFSVDLKNIYVKHMATYCPWNSHQIHSSCISMSLWWQNNSSLWVSWTVSIPKWVPILWHAAFAPSDAKLLEGGVEIVIIAPVVVEMILKEFEKIAVDLPQQNACTTGEYCACLLRYTMNIYIYTARCRYNAVNFLTNIHKRHPIARPLGRGMGCFLWVHHLIDILPQFLKLFMQYLTILDRVITALDCIYMCVCHLTHFDDHCIGKL